MQYFEINNMLKKCFVSRFIAIIILISTVTISVQPISALYAQDVQADSAQKKVFLPLVVSSQQEAEPRSPAVVLSAEEAAVETMLLNEPGQKHPLLKLSPLLVEEARRKAQDMATRVYFSHTDPNGFGANYWARKAGYVFPDYYGTEPDANNIESIGAGYSDAQAVWDAWMASNGHRSHLLGEHQFYQEQLEYGIGYVHVDNGSFGHYWVVLISKPG